MPLAKALAAQLLALALVAAAGSTRPARRSFLPRAVLAAEAYGTIPPMPPDAALHDSQPSEPPEPSPYM